MNKINNDLQIFGGYFKGIHEIAEHKTIGKVALGILKVISYATLLVPIIFAVGYLIVNAKQNNLSSLYNRVTKALNPGFNGAIPTENDYIKFLAAKVQDKEYSSFEAAFNELSPISQRVFFAKMSMEDNLIESMKQIPTDLTKIEFSFGDFLGVWNFKKANNLIKEFLIELDSFDNFEKIVVDLTRVASYTHNVQLILDTSLSSSFISDPYGDAVELSRTYSEPNNISGAACALRGLIKHLQEHAETKSIDILFREFTGQWQERKITLKKDENTSEIQVE